MKHIKKLLVLAAAAVGGVGLATTGWAFWSASGTGSASGAVSSLTAPSAVSASQPTPGVGTVHVAWTPPIAPDGTTVSSFSVQRFSGSTPSSACGGVITATGCDDTGVAAGSYTYKVTALFRSWTAQSAASAPVTVVLDTTPPTVSSINRAGSSPTNASSVSWTVTFSENVTGVDATDFSLVQAAGVSGASISSVTGSGTTYSVTASTGSGNGTLGLNLVDNNSIIDGANNPLGGAGGSLDGGFTGQVYSIDKTAPTVISINRSGSNPTNATAVSWTVTFSENVSGVTSANFGLVQAGGVSGASISSVDSVSYTVSAGTGSGDGTLGVNLTSISGIADAAGNALSATTPVVGQVYTIDKTAPTVTIVKATAQADPTNALPINYTVTFSESMTGFTNSGLTLGGTSTGTKSAVVTGSGTTYNVAVSGATGTGTVTALVKAAAAVDAAGNANTASPATATVNYDITAPTVTINQAAGQADPTNSGTVNFTVVFSESVTGFTNSDVTIGGTAGGTKTAAVTGGPSTYNVAISGATGNGTITTTVPVSAAQDAAGNNSAASTSTDNTVTLDTTAPTGSGVSTSNGGGTAGLPEPGDSVSLTFSEEINTATILAGWSGSATNIVVHGNDGGSGTDTLTFFNSANNTQLPLGSLDLGSKKYFTGNVTFGASGTASSMSAVTTGSKTVLTVTFGTVSDTTKTGTDNQSILTWTPSSAVTDLAGNALNPATTPVTGNIKQF
jgi:Bacterial Ig-like domain